MRKLFAQPITRRVALALLALIVIGVGFGVYTQANAFSYGDLLAALHARGATVQEGGSASNVLFNGSGHGLLVNGAEVSAYEYATTFTTEMDANRVSPDGTEARSGFGPFGGSGVAVDWIAPAHHYRMGRIIVSYIGFDASITSLLAAVLGPQFAGGSTSAT